MTPSSDVHRAPSGFLDDNVLQNFQGDTLLKVTIQPRKASNDDVKIILLDAVG